jgi:NAD(P)-dependent dehydrogenase (short-subunit alcohol dehydrogenase family)
VEHFDRDIDYQVFFTARDERKAEEMMQGLQSSDYILMDFSRFETVVQGAKELAGRLTHLDVLINNAGTWQMAFKETTDGLETNFAVNHLAPMLLTLELLPLLERAPAARIINTSSGAHRRDILNFDDLEFRDTEYNGIATYSQSKLCNLLFSLGLKSRLEESSRITVNTVHPGYVKSELFNNMEARSWEAVPSAEHGARSAIYVATSPKLEGVSGEYFYLEAKEQRLSPLGSDPVLAQKLWEISLGYIKKFLTDPD